VVNHEALRTKFNVLHTLVVLLLATAMVGLGLWQLKRADYKKSILSQQKTLAQQTPQQYSNINENLMQKYMPVTAIGSFDNQHQFLIDNKTLNGRVGYDVLTPLQIDAPAKTILVNRGWVPRGKTRHEQPVLAPITGIQHITGFFDQPGKPLLLSRNNDESNVWPHILQRIDTTEISQALGYPINPYIIQLKQPTDYTYRLHWQVVYGQPSRHTGYAIQWFLFAVILLVGDFFLQTRKQH
jgi:surfeit locus 1 family protein